MAGSDKGEGALHYSHLSNHPPMNLVVVINENR